MGWPVPSTDLRNSPGQRLLARAGMLWSRKWAWIRGPIPSVEQLLIANVQKVLKMAKAVEANWDNRIAYGFKNKSLEYYKNILSFLSQKIIPNEIFSDFNEWLYNQYLALNLTYPVKDLNKKPFTRLLAPAYHTFRDVEPGQPPAPGSDYYPGSVDPSAPRVTRSFEFDFNKQTFKNRLRVIYEIGHRLSNGLYAAPGDPPSVWILRRDKLHKVSGLVRLYYPAEASLEIDNTTIICYLNSSSRNFWSNTVPISRARVRTGKISMRLPVE